MNTGKTVSRARYYMPQFVLDKLSQYGDSMGWYYFARNDRFTYITTAGTVRTIITTGTYYYTVSIYCDGELSERVTCYSVQDLMEYIKYTVQYY